jgi:hypothetical protein
MPSVVDKDHLKVAGAIRAALAEYEGARDLIEVGAYAHGSNPAIDEAIALRPALEGFLCQELEESSDIAAARRSMETTGVLQARALMSSGAQFVAARPTEPGQAAAAAQSVGAPVQGSAAAASAPQPRPSSLPPVFRSEAPR